MQLVLRMFKFGKELFCTDRVYPLKLTVRNSSSFLSPGSLGYCKNQAQEIGKKEVRIFSKVLSVCQYNSVHELEFSKVLSSSFHSILRNISEGRQGPSPRYPLRPREVKWISASKWQGRDKSPGLCLQILRFSLYTVQPHHTQLWFLFFFQEDKAPLPLATIGHLAYACLVTTQIKKN